jgi:hypothetical protein
MGTRMIGTRRPSKAVNGVEIVFIGSGFRRTAIEGRLAMSRCGSAKDTRGARHQQAVAVAALNRRFGV